MEIPAIGARPDDFELECCSFLPSAERTCLGPYVRAATGRFAGPGPLRSRFRGSAALVESSDALTLRLRSFAPREVPHQEPGVRPLRLAQRVEIPQLR